MKLGIIGKGFVGSAVANGFNKDVEQFIIDPKYTDNTIEQLVNEFNPPLLFVCVPTPQQDTHLDVDTYLVREVLKSLTHYEYKGIVVFRSSARRCAATGSISMWCWPT